MAKGRNKKKHSSKKPDEIHDSWIELSKEISDRINDITKERAKESEELYEIWSEYAKKMTEHMGKFSSDEGIAFEDMQNMWTDYSGKIGDRFFDLLKKENGPYKELYQLWTEYSGKMSEHLSELMNETMKEQRDLYELWMDSFGVKDKSLDSDFSTAFKTMNQFWLDMWEKTRDVLPSTGEGDKSLDLRVKELNDLWTKNYSRMIIDIMRSPAFAKMNGNILDSNLEIKRLNDQFKNQYLSSLGLPTKENLDDIYRKLHDIDRKISEIYRALNSNKTKAKK